MPELIQLVEASWKDIFQGDVIRNYEIYSGTWMQVYGSSANPYWHTYDQWVSMGSPHYCHVKNIMVLADGAYVGHWDALEDFYAFLKDYMRAEILVTVGVN